MNIAKFKNACFIDNASFYLNGSFHDKSFDFELNLLSKRFGHLETLIGYEIRL